LKNSKEKYSQEALIEGIRHNDGKVIGFLYDEYYRSIRLYILNNSGNEEDSRDIFQEALIVLFQKIRDNKYQVLSSLKTFLYSVANILWHKELRRRKSMPATELGYQSMADQEIIEAIERKEKFDFYREKYEELSADCKRIIHLFLNNIPIKEITALMGYSSDQHTKNRHLRCKKSLITRIQSSSKFKELGHG
jgi:RNA polymerase sigma factor (sigma-70 family)